MDSAQSKHEAAVALAEAGRHEEALALLREHLLDCPGDGEALNDAGAVLFALGRLEEAERHLRLAIERLPDRPGQALANLAEVCLARRRADKAVAILDDLATEGLLTEDLTARTADVLLEAADPADVVEDLLASASVPGQGRARSILLAELRARRPRVALVDAPEALYRFVRQRFEARRPAGTDPGELAGLLRWARIAWFTRCGPRLAAAAKRLRAVHAAVCVRPGDIEGPWFDEVPWEAVDLAVAVGSETFADVLARRLPEHIAAGRLARLDPPVHLLPPLPARRGRGEALRLACLDGLELAGNPMFLLQCFRALRRARPDCTLHFAGYCRDDALQHYLHHAVAELGLGPAVRFDGWQEDLADWLADKQCVVSAGIAESRLEPVLQAAAAGLKPVVHSFPGARDLLGEEALFATEEQFVSRVLGGPHDPAAVREALAGRFGPEPFARGATALLNRMEQTSAGARTDPHRAAAATFRPTWRDAPPRPTRAGAERPDLDE